MTNKIGIESFILVCILTLLLGCTEKEDENVAGPYNGPTLLLPMEIGGRSGTILADDNISSVRVIVFAPNDKLVSNVVTNTASAATVEVKATVADGLNQIYVICNETAELKSKLEAVTSGTSIEQISFATNPQVSPLLNPIVMYRVERNITVTVSGSDVMVQREGETPTTKLSVTSKRVMAKLSMTIIKNTTKAIEPFDIESMSYHIARMPAIGFMTEGTKYTGPTWASDIMVESIGNPIRTDGEYEIVPGSDERRVKSGDFMTFPDIYIPEHYMEDRSDGARGTYLMISAKCKKKNGMVVDVLYKVELGNNPPANMQIDRNVHYRIYATVTALGAMGFYAEIVPSKMVEVPVTWAEFEGLVVVSELNGDFDKNKDTYMDYSHYFGILKMNQGKTKGGVKDVVFKQGSVIGINVAADAAADYATDQAIAVPASFKDAIDTWDKVPYTAGPPVHDKTNVAKGLGDPCKLVGLTTQEIEGGVVDNKMWCMATSADYLHLIAGRNQHNHTKPGESVFDQDGYRSLHYMTLPSMGSRTATGGLVPKANLGNYWGAGDGKVFSFVNNDLNSGVVATAADAAAAYSVRCVRIVPPVSEFATGKLFEMSYTSSGYESTYSPQVSNVPFWTIECVNAADNSEIKFQDDKMYGLFNERLPYTVTDLPNPYLSRTFDFKVKAYGLETGYFREFDYQIRQKTIEHLIGMSFNPEIPMENGYPRIPQKGIEYEVTIQISPRLIPIGNETKVKWSVVFSEVNPDGSLTELKRSDITAGAGNTAKIVIPENISGDSKNVQFSISIANMNELKPLPDTHPTLSLPIKYLYFYVIQK